MKINGKSYLGYRLRSLSNWALLLACLVTGSITGGCRSSRNVVEETTAVEHHNSESYDTNDSISGAASDSICRRETNRGSAGERGRIDIERDSAGRPVVILWNVHSDFSATATAQTLGTGLFTLRGSSSVAQSSNAVDSLTEKTEETKEEVNPAIPLEQLIGSGLILLVIIYLIYVFFADVLVPWIRQRRK